MQPSAWRHKNELFSALDHQDVMDLAQRDALLAVQRARGAALLRARGERSRSGPCAGNSARADGRYARVGGAAAAVARTHSGRAAAVAEVEIVYAHKLALPQHDLPRPEDEASFGRPLLEEARLGLRIGELPLAPEHADLLARLAPAEACGDPRRRLDAHALTALQLGPAGRGVRAVGVR